MDPIPYLIAIFFAVMLLAISYVYFPSLFYLILLIVGIALFVKIFVRKYDEYERAIIFRFGRFNRIAGPGWAIVIPFIEKEYRRIDVRTRTLPIEIPAAFTKDDLRLKIDGVVYYRIKDPSKALLKLQDYMQAMKNAIVSTVRNVIAKMTMRELFGGLDKLNDLVADALRTTLYTWGIDVPMVQIRQIMPPEEVVVAMEQKEIAAQYLQAQKFRAEARKVVLEAIGEAAKKLDDRAILYLYFKALEEMSKGKATKIVFPARFFDVVAGMQSDIAKQLAGINVAEAINAIKNVLSK